MNCHKSLLVILVYADVHFRSSVCICRHLILWAKFCFIMIRAAAFRNLHLYIITRVVLLHFLPEELKAKTCVSSNMKYFPASQSHITPTNDIRLSERISGPLIVSFYSKREIASSIPFYRQHQSFPHSF